MMIILHILQLVPVYNTVKISVMVEFTQTRAFVCVSVRACV